MSLTHSLTYSYFEQSFLLQHGFNDWVATSEEAEGLLRINSVACGVNMLANSARSHRVKAVAYLLESLKSVGIQDFSPQVHVVRGGVRTG